MGRRVTTTSQPQYPAQIDWRNPICSGIVSVYNGGGTPSPYSPSARPNSVGSGGIANRNQATLISCSPQIDQSKDMTIMAFLEKQNVDGPVVAFSAAFVATNQFCLGVQNNSFAVFDGSAQASAGDTIAPGKSACVIGTFTASNRLIVPYANGIPGSTITANAAMTGVSASSRVGAFTAANPFTYPGNVFLAAAWQRVLSLAEIRSISTNPWQVFL